MMKVNEKQGGMMEDDEILEAVLSFIVPKRKDKTKTVYSYILTCPTCNNEVGLCDCYCKHCGQKLMN